MNILYPKPAKIKTLNYLRKYIDNGKYICAWQSDSAQFSQPTFRSDQYIKNKNNPTDRFYIIDIKREQLEGPMGRKQFIKRAKELKIKIEWKPEVQE